VAALVIGVPKIWSMLHVAVPEFPPVEKSVWLDQNWKPAAREWYRHANQGGQFPPMINVPYEWFLALEQPHLSIGDAGGLADQAYLDRFGFIPSSTEDGAYDWRSCKEPHAQKYGVTPDYDTGPAVGEEPHSARLHMQNGPDNGGHRGRGARPDRGVDQRPVLLPTAPHHAPLHPVRPPRTGGSAIRHTSGLGVYGLPVGPCGPRSPPSARRSGERASDQ